MIIDWFTVGAQILNFLVLVWLLKRFLYQPVLDAIDKREKRIAAALAEAAQSKAQAAAQRDDLQAKSDAFDKARAALLAKAAADADIERKRLVGAAREEADALKDKHRKALARDARNLSAEISHLAETEVFGIARKALADMADAELEARMSALFIARIAGLEGAEKSKVAEMLAASAGPVLIRSAFDLPAAQRAAISKAINTAFATDVELSFETAPGLVSGIELAAAGQKLAWTISDYLKTLERNVVELLKSSSDNAKGAA